MKLRKKYKDINETLFYIGVQVRDSLKFADKVCPVTNDPRKLFKWLKSRVHYKNDPRGVELLQTMQTLFKNKGKGDCDCFVIAGLACLIVNEFPDIRIALVGRERKAPVHIYIVIYENGERYVFDLTNPRFNQERPTYNYIQEIPVRWQNWKF